jgi:hypothetical protein
MEININQVERVNNILGDIHNLFWKHWQGIGFDWRMRRCETAPTKDEPMYQSASPTNANEYFNNFISPYNQQLIRLKTVAITIQEDILLPSYIETKIDKSFEFAQKYGNLLLRFSKEDIDSPYYDIIVTYYQKQFCDAGNPSIKAFPNFLNREAKVELLERAEKLHKEGISISNNNNELETIIKILGVRQGRCMDISFDLYKHSLGI